CAGYATL
ncbi:Glutamate 5-kinase, partial [Haemophilus influenzae]